MTDQQKDRLVAFVYLLTRGTPEHEGVPWGAVKGILREHLAQSNPPIFSSKAGEALAREIVDELIGVPEVEYDLLDSLSDIGRYLFENGISNAAEIPEDPYIMGRLRCEHDAVVTLFKSGKASLQGKCSGAQRKTIADLLRAAGWQVK